MYIYDFQMAETWNSIKLDFLSLLIMRIKNFKCGGASLKNQMMKVEYVMDVASRTLNRCLVVYTPDAVCFLLKVWK